MTQIETNEILEVLKRIDQRLTSWEQRLPYFKVEAQMKAMRDAGVFTESEMTRLQALALGD